MVWKHWIKKLSFTERNQRPGDWPGYPNTFFVPWFIQFVLGNNMSLTTVVNKLINQCQSAKISSESPTFLNREAIANSNDGAWVELKEWLNLLGTLSYTEFCWVYWMRTFLNRFYKIWNSLKTKILYLTKSCIHIDSIVLLLLLSLKSGKFLLVTSPFDEFKLCQARPTVNKYWDESIHIWRPHDRWIQRVCSIQGGERF